MKGDVEVPVSAALATVLLEAYSVMDTFTGAGALCSMLAAQNLETLGAVCVIEGGLVCAGSPRHAPNHKPSLMPTLPVVL